MNKEKVGEEMFPSDWEKEEKRLSKALKECNEIANQQKKKILGTKSLEELENSLDEHFDRLSGMSEILTEHEYRVKYYEKEMEITEKQLVFGEYEEPKEEFMKRLTNAYKVWRDIYRNLAQGLELQKKAELLWDLITWKCDILLSKSIRNLTYFLLLLTGVLVILTVVLAIPIFT